MKLPMKLRRIFNAGRMNLDTDNRELQQGEYREATNIVILNNEGGNSGALRKSMSNKRLTNLPLGTKPITLGQFTYEARGRIYWLVKSDDGCYLCEWDHNTQSAAFVLQDTRDVSTRVFNLNENFLCTAINIVTSEDENKELMLLTDNNMQPLCFNISRAKTYPVNGFEKEDIYLIKKPPRFAPTAALTYTGGLENYMEEEFLSFSYRYKYLDGEYSALSDYTNYRFAPGEFELDYQTLLNNGMVNQFNAVRIGFNTGDKRVTDIQLIVKRSNSNTLYLIETFNKADEGWDNSVVKSYNFANNKIYTALPERELYRSFDNVPLKALAQTIIGNRVFYGNYLEGYDMIDGAGRRVSPEYSLSILSDDITGSDVPYTILSPDITGGTKIVIVFTDIDLAAGTSIRLSLVMLSTYTEGSSTTSTGSYDGSVDYILGADYANVGELAQDPDFINFINNILTASFNTNVEFTPPTDGVLTNIPAFSFTYTTNTITITAPVYNYQIDNTPGDTGDDDFTYRDYFWKFQTDTSISFRDFSVASSVKTNRSYEVGIIYEDDFNRKTIVLTSKNNTIYVPQGNTQQIFSISRNRIKVTLDSLPPAWADRYKFVVKQQKLTYHIIYGIKFYEDGLFRWVKLEGANLDKVSAGDTLIVKSDLGGPVGEVMKMLILEKVTKEKNFLEDNENADGDEIFEEQGVYIKVKPAPGIDMNYSSSTALTFEGGSSLRYTARTYTQPAFGVIDPDTDVFTPYPLNAGSQVHIFISFDARGNIAYHEEYDKNFVVNSNYDSVEDWFNAEVEDLGSFGDDFTREYGFNDEGRQFYVWSHRDGTASQNIRTTVRFEIVFTQGLMIFETEPIQTDLDIFFETEQAFDIIDGFHTGNLQNQNDALPAEIELDFFNCYVMGNGAECYRIKDAVNKNSLNIDLRPSTTSIEEYKAIRRTADITYGEAYVESSNINGLNVFNLSTGNFKDNIDKQYGSIQKLWARDNDIVVLQEEKPGQVLYDKDAIYTADGNENLVSIPGVLGRYIPFGGNRGIGKHPESFSIDDDGRIKYASVGNGAIVRLSRDGVEDIVYGVRDFFRRLFINQPNAKVLSGYDPFRDETVFSIGEEPTTIPRFNCSDIIMRSDISEDFTYDLLLNNLSGDIIVSYNITGGNATVSIQFNGIQAVESNVTGSGNLVLERDSLVENIVRVAITPTSGTISYTLTNTCPIGSELTIVQLVLNDSADTGQTMTDRFKKTGSSFISTDELFMAPPVTRFETITGLEGVGAFPVNGDLVTIQAFKNTTNSGDFRLTECNRLGYLISDVIYTSDDYQDILDNPDTVFLTVTETGEEGFSTTNFGNFVFSRTDADQRLYLIWDYTNRSPVIFDDSANVNVGQTVNIDVLANDDVSAGAIVTIGTGPMYGIAVVQVDRTVNYTHDGSSNYNDSFTYIVTEKGCSSEATVFVSIGIGCGDALSASGGTGIYEVEINFGTDTGFAGIEYNAQSVPDKFDLIWNGILVATSKYVGDGLDPGPPVSYAGLLGPKTLSVFEYDGATFVDTGVDENIDVIQDDIADGSPEYPTDGQGIIYFEKTTPLPATVTLRVTGAVGGTAWSLVNVICPQPEPPVFE